MKRSRSETQTRNRWNRILPGWKIAAAALLVFALISWMLVFREVNPLRGEELYVYPYTVAAQQAEDWSQSRPEDAEAIRAISERPQGIWISDDSDDTFASVRDRLDEAESRNELAVLVAYNIPYRDCSLESVSGSSSATSYRAWIATLAETIGESRAAVIVEPDAASLADCLPEEQRTERLALLRGAVRALADQPNTTVYLDAGHSDWVPAGEISPVLEEAGIGYADGFSLNVAAYQGTESIIAYGRELSGEVGGKNFVVDTSRNGNGSPGNAEWCNPPGRALGESPTTQTGERGVDAFLWIKPPGESDGECNGGPPAGTFWPDYALNLAREAGF